MNWVSLLLEAIATTASVAAKALAEDWDDAPKRVLEVWGKSQAKAALEMAKAEAAEKFDKD